VRPKAMGWLNLPHLSTCTFETPDPTTQRTVKCYSWSVSETGNGPIWRKGLEEKMSFKYWLNYACVVSTFMRGNNLHYISGLRSWEPFICWSQLLPTAKTLEGGPVPFGQLTDFQIYSYMKAYRYAM